MFNKKIDKLLDEIVKEHSTQEELFGKDGIMDYLRKSLVEKALQGELTNHLGYEKHEKSGYQTGNSRNGFSKKQLKTKDSEIEINVPRDRKSEFEPQLIKKHQNRWTELDDKILYLYGSGCSTEQIRDQLYELYSVEVSKQFISTVTDSVAEDVLQFRNRPLEAVYPIIYLDAIFVKSRTEERKVVKRAVYLALGINMDGRKELLGMYIGLNEGAKFWLNVLTDLKNRGLMDIPICCVDGLSGFPDAIETVFPEASIQLCLVHQVRNSLKYVASKDRKKVATDLKDIYRADTLELAESNLEKFGAKWDAKYPHITKSWRKKWENLTVFFSFTKEIRKVIYTTNAIESLNYSLRRISKTRGVFPTDDSIYKLLYLGLKHISKKWTMPIQEWNLALNQLAIHFEGRIVLE